MLGADYLRIKLLYYFRTNYLPVIPALSRNLIFMNKYPFKYLNICSRKVVRV